MANKVLKSSFILLIGNLLFRVGGYINRLLMSRMLGPEGYGLYGLTLPFQGIFQNQRMQVYLYHKVDEQQRQCSS